MEDCDVVARENDLRCAGHGGGDGSAAGDARGEQWSGSGGGGMEEDVFCFVADEERVAAGPDHAAHGVGQRHLALEFEG